MNDGTIVPHYLSIGRTNPQTFDASAFNDVALRVGEVVQIHYPDDPTNISKKVMEYTVNVQYRQGNGAPVNRLYRATVSDLFGTQGDSLRYTLRASRGEKAGQSLTDGARVLLACPNGESNAAVIISGVRHTQAVQDPPRAAGDFLNFEFNGLQVQINDDGELTIVNQGNTLNDGSPDSRDPHNAGTTVKLSKDGSVLIDNKQGDSIQIDTTGRKINISARDKQTTTEQSWTLTAGKDVQVQAGGDTQIHSNGQTRLGGSGASENLVLGNKLVEALTAFVEKVLLQNAATFSQFVAAPLPMHPKLLAAITEWEAQYLKGAPAAILATDKFTER